VPSSSVSRCSLGRVQSGTCAPLSSSITLRVSWRLVLRLFLVSAVAGRENLCVWKGIEIVCVCVCVCLRVYVQFVPSWEAMRYGSMPGNPADNQTQPKEPQVNLKLFCCVPVFPNSTVYVYGMAIGCSQSLFWYWLKFVIHLKINCP